MSLKIYRHTDILQNFIWRVNKRLSFKFFGIYVLILGIVKNKMKINTETRRGK